VSDIPLTTPHRAGDTIIAPAVPPVDWWAFQLGALSVVLKLNPSLTYYGFSAPGTNARSGRLWYMADRARLFEAPWDFDEARKWFARWKKLDRFNRTGTIDELHRIAYANDPARPSSGAFVAAAIAEGFRVRRTRHGRVFLNIATAAFRGAR
jgi:hypothetical protein